MITLSAQHEIDNLKREVARLKYYESQHKIMVEQLNDCKRRVKYAQAGKSKYKKKYHNAVGFKPIGAKNKSDAIDLVAAIKNGFAMTLKDVSIITSVPYSTIKSISRSLNGA